jgi:hypothetical protein
MPWSSRNLPQTPNVLAGGSKGNLNVVWSPVPGCSQYAIQVRVGQTWRLSTITRGTKMILKGMPDAVAVSAVDRFGNTSHPRVLARR